MSNGNTAWPLRWYLWRGFWILLILKLNFNIVYYSATSLSYFIWHGCLKLLETNMWKKPHHLIGQLLEILPCKLISQHAIFYKARWMLTSDPLFKFALVHEIIVHGLFEMFLHGFSLKILSETITDVNSNFTPSCRE